jgi:hypothetical protein
MRKYENCKSSESTPVSDGGFTVAEIVIAVFLGAIITSAGMALYLTQHKQMLVQDEISDMQYGLRAATADIAEKIRMAGYKVPDGLTAIVASNTNPDSIAIVYDSDALPGVQLEWPMPRPSSELRCDGHDISGLHEGDWVYIYDPNTKTGEFFQATQVQYSSSHIQHNTMDLSKAYPSGSQVIKINRFQYYIDRTDPNHPNLMQRYAFNPPQIYAENITNLNFSYLISNGAVVDVPPVVDMVREIIIRVDARTDKADNQFQTQYRTRSLVTRAMVRNLGAN